MSEWKLATGESYDGSVITDGRIELAVISYDSNVTHQELLEFLPKVAAALNASAQRDAERKLLEKMAVYIRDDAEGSYWKFNMLPRAKALLAEYAALQAEVSDPTDADPK